MSDGVSTTLTAEGVGRPEDGTVGSDDGDGEGVRRRIASVRLLIWEDRVPRSIGSLRTGKEPREEDAVASGESSVSSSMTAGSNGNGVAWDTAGVIAAEHNGGY